MTSPSSILLSSLFLILLSILLSSSPSTTTAFIVTTKYPTLQQTTQQFQRHSTATTTTSSSLKETIVSPFDDSAAGDVDVATETPPTKVEGPLDLTWDNVELVLDEMRPFLIQDGGNVAIKEIDGPVVRLELEVRV